MRADIGKKISVDVKKFDPVTEFPDSTTYYVLFCVIFTYKKSYLVQIINDKNCLCCSDY